MSPSPISDSDSRLSCAFMHAKRSATRPPLNGRHPAHDVFTGLCKVGLRDPAAGLTSGFRFQAGAAARGREVHPSARVSAA
jgi:hypothetical protein